MIRGSVIAVTGLLFDFHKPKSLPRFLLGFPFRDWALESCLDAISAALSTNFAKRVIDCSEIYSGYKWGSVAGYVSLWACATGLENNSWRMKAYPDPVRKGLDSITMNSLIFNTRSTASPCIKSILDAC